MGKSKRGKKKVVTASIAPEMDSDVPELMDINDTADEQAQVEEILRQAQNISEKPVEEVAIDVEEDVPMIEIRSIKQRKRKLEAAKTRKISENNVMVIDLDRPPQKADGAQKRVRLQTELRRVSVPPHRYSSLKENWTKLVEVVVKQLDMQIRYNLKTRIVEIRCPKEDSNKANLQKAADFVRAFVLGFGIDDAVSLVRLDHLFLESFAVTDVKILHGDNLSRAIGRIAGKEGRTKHTIENVTKTRIVLADQKIHLLGSYQNLRVARHTICSLILGTPPNKIYGNLRNLSSRLAERL